MDENDRDLLHLLRDRSEVAEVVLRYARGVDRRDLEAVARCFTEDAAYQGALATTGIAAALESLARSLPRYAATFHFMGPPAIEVSGDGALAETCAIAYHRTVGTTGAEDLVLAVRYHDDLVRRSDGWRIRRRRAETVWTRRDPVAGDPAEPPAPGAAPGPRAPA